jgi:hypothetical protein
VPLERSSRRFAQYCLRASSRSQRLRHRSDGCVGAWAVDALEGRGQYCRQHLPGDLGVATGGKPCRAGDLLGVLLCRLQARRLLQNLNQQELRINRIKTLLRDN